MATQFTFTLPDQPGSLASIAESIASAGINIDGITGITASGQGIVYLVTNNFETTETALKDSGIQYSSQEVLMINLEDKPGQIAKLSRALANEGINLNTFYITMSGHQVLGSDNMDRTKEIANELGMA
ncbi:MAG: hypothetical protein ACE5GN_05755 [Waddliaceae bacterium]